MVKSCSANGCKTICTEDTVLYKFPATRALRSRWAVAAAGAGLARAGRGAALCAAHFTPADFTLQRGRSRLRATAVPSVFNEESPEKSIKNQKSIEKLNITENSESTVSVNNKEDVVIKQNGNTDRQESIQNSSTEEKDIEDMITNYQIKQTKSLADRLNPEPLEDLIPTVLANSANLASGANLANRQPDSASNQDISAKDKITNLANNKLTNVAKDNLANNKLANLAKDKLVELAKDKLAELAGNLANRQSASLQDETPLFLLGVDAEPVFIEVPVNKGGASRAGSPADCLMVVESVQCDVDPTSLLHHADTDTDTDLELVEKGKEDPISLLTSSDEDEVIIEEPHIDTVEVSDESDEDDKPLKTLIKTKKKKKKYNLNCSQCDYKTNNQSEYKKHTIIHSTAIEVCQVCGYTTASKAQFSRHKRKHRDERNYKCHLCNYKAKHNMSLIYHLKSHDSAEKRPRPSFQCEKCGFKTSVKSEGLKHLKGCEERKYSCDSCSYETKRRSDLKRHRLRRHADNDCDDDDFVL